MRKRGTNHHCPAWEGRLIKAGDPEQDECSCDDHVVADVGPFVTHLRYRGEEFPIEDVVRAVKLMPQLKQLARLLPGPWTCVNNAKPQTPKRRARRGTS